MQINDFIKNLEQQLSETEPGLIHPDIEFRNIEEWSSLVALMVIAMVDEEYNVALTGDDIRNSTTIQDLFDKVVSK